MSKDKAVKDTERKAAAQDATKHDNNKQENFKKKVDWEIERDTANDAANDENTGAVHHDFVEGDKTEHQFVRSVDERKNTGRETMHVHAPEVALSLTGGDSAQKLDNSWQTQNGKTITVNNAVAPVDEKKFDFSEHPLLQLKAGQGMFIPNRPGLTTDELLNQLNKEVRHLRAFGAQVEKDENGDDILETVIIEEKKRNDDGTIALTAGRPIVGALQQNRPKLIHATNFTVHAVVKDYDMGGQKAPEDGVLVIRV